MFDIKALTEDFTRFEEGWGRRQQPTLNEAALKLKDFVSKRRELIHSHEKLLAERNRASQEVGKLKKAGGDISGLLDAQKKLGEDIKKSDESLSTFQNDFENLLKAMPNIPQDSVPLGKGAEENQEVQCWGAARPFSFEPLPHEVLGEKRGWFDFERAAEITGARFSVSKGAAAKLERILTQWMLDVHTTENGYTEISPPLIVNDQSLYGTGNLPKFKEDLFKIEGLPYFLIPTAEVPVTNLHARSEIAHDKLNLSYTAYTPCFRSEAGSHGKDLKGLIRQHQFNKVELVKITKPEDSDAEHQKMRRDAERILELLELPYRTMVLSTGDMGFASSKTFDLEVWLPSQKSFREISSVSNCWDFQSRRMNTRFRDKDGKLAFVHTLNGSGLAVGRTLIAVLENYQNSDGTVTLPNVLRPYYNGLEII